jgi:hypothetical protein
MHRDFEQNHRQPKLLQLYYRSGHFKHSADHSKSVAMPPAVLQLLSSSRSHLSGGGAACQRQGIGQLSGTQGLQRIGAVDMEAAEAKQDQQSSVQVNYQQLVMKRRSYLVQMKPCRKQQIDGLCFLFSSLGTILTEDCVTGSCR